MQKAVILFYLNAFVFRILANKQECTGAKLFTEM